MNQDDVSAYHLFYADAKGSPGTDLTFFDWAAISPRRLGNRIGTDGVVHVYEMGRGGPGAELHVRVRPELSIGQTGAGGVHHVAFRVPDDQYDAWADRLQEYGIPNSGKVDRFYFRSLYFREPHGVLFELATDGQGGRVQSCVAFYNNVFVIRGDAFQLGLCRRQPAVGSVMKAIVPLIGLSSALALTHALAWERVLLDTYTAPQNWEITSQELGLKSTKPFSVRMRMLHGGRQEGVCIVDIDTGAMRISVVPTRGMDVLEAVAGSVRIGWNSPVSEVVNPAFVELNGRGGLGWLEGFNEMVTRCGYEWVGHPGMDKGVLLTLHGLAANIPASKVVLSIDGEPPYTIRLKGELKEQAFKLVNFVIATELSTEAGAQSFTLHDTLTNNGDYPKEYEALYHSNFGPPLLDPGARFAAPVQQVSPFNDRAAADTGDWQTYREPTRDYDETVWNVVPYGDENGETLTVLHNAAGDLGISLGYNIEQLPVFSLWKNTDTLGQGYVTGLEPGTSFAYNRSYQRALNRVPTIGAKEHRQFDITYTLLPDKAAVDKALQQVQSIQHNRPTEERKTPLVELPKH